MADSSDVEIALAGLVGRVLFPSGVQGIGAYDDAAAGGWTMASAYGSLMPLNSAAGMPVRVYRGWPTAQQLDPDLKAGIAHVSIFKGTGMGRLATGTMDEDKTIPAPPPTIFATVSGNAVILSGVPSPQTLVGLLIDGQGYVWPVQPGDTLLSIAAGLASQIAGEGNLTTDTGGAILNLAGVPITTGDTAIITPLPDGTVMLTFGTTAPIVTRVMTFGGTIRRARQQTESFKLTCWAPSWQARDAICKFVDQELADLRWLPLPDQAAWMLWTGTRNDDVPSKAALWRRDVTYNVQYYTTVTRFAPPMLFGVLVHLAVEADASATTTIL